MTKEQAINYLKSSGFSDEQITSVTEALSEERKTGRWNEDGTCSVCGTYSSLNLSKVKYCPECGAEMKGGAE